MTDRLSEQQVDAYAVLAITADHEGRQIDPAVVTVLVDEVRRLEEQRRFLMRQLAKRDAASGRGDAALAEFLGGSDTLPAWLRHRFTASAVSWEHLDDGERSYWEHQASAVRRAVARGGFKATEPSAARVGVSPVSEAAGGGRGAETAPHAPGRSEGPGNPAKRS